MTIYIALGANLSNPKETFIEALDKLAEAAVEITSVSGLWESRSWPPGQGHPDYLNAVAEVKFPGSAQQLLHILQNTENEFGRMRSVRNAPRSLDLDILDFHGQILKSDKLKIPHPRMLSRSFVLFPLEQLDPEWVDPVSGHSIDHFIVRLPLADTEPMKYLGYFFGHG